MNCLYTCNVKHALGFNIEFISERVRRSFLSACFRWGCNYAEINHYDPDFPICHWAKLDGPKYLSGYDKLLYLDGDMVISDHAPNPFELCVDDGAMYAVADGQGPNPCPAWEQGVKLPGMEKMRERYPLMAIPPNSHYFNSGFMMFANTGLLRSTFALAHSNRDLGIMPSWDQSIINMCVFNGMRVEILPEKWNHILFGRPWDPEAYINHNCGAGALQT